MLKSMSFNGQRNNSIYLLQGRSKSPYHQIVAKDSNVYLDKKILTKEVTTEQKRMRLRERMR